MTDSTSNPLINNDSQPDDRRASSGSPGTDGANTQGTTDPPRGAAASSVTHNCPR